ncbi:DegT/DnrJ/EryC1/StrS family aminotransferase [Aliivibrio fischeri]|uniref:DegT/DnrJ/EryC1/StrS family aminotransferase n=1 Tax=Aliivibrio fischeri TaxID=668 RepID=UPI0012DA12BA|nr:DegT/DnrJ/EryC1/StrS family aminotransferase [Aliivibrio fischeri]MUK67953.1 DegT/DnrJ/EryC1/StrS family aminotransferase [Aliivibrio fischeri]MUK72900.1 DegT/DnrJ/EryC1/StrS family aminotransferase [Aliivibrio fischeri]
MKKITVTTPLLPPIDELKTYLEDIWQRKWLTNNGYYHQLLESELCNYLGVKHVSLFSNGTLALTAAMQALELKGEVITTPYSFVATSHSVMLNNLTPVFVDIEPETFNLDPEKIEAAITDKTCAILPVHVYGNPCDHQAIQSIADKYDLKVIYDAAHAFGVKKDECSILNWGDLSILSFHATKAYSTIEGGAIICHTPEMKKKLDKLKSFGFDSDTELSLLGTNAKMNEVQAAFGLASLGLIDNAIEKRQQVAKIYRKTLADVKGIRYLEDIDGVNHNYSYFPIIIDELEYGLSRDALYKKLHENNILARRYFYPLITEFKLYKNNVNTVQYSNNIAKDISDNVICLPIHHEININDVNEVLRHII